MGRCAVATGAAARAVTDHCCAAALARHPSPRRASRTSPPRPSHHRLLNLYTELSQRPKIKTINPGPPPARPNILRILGRLGRITAAQFSAGRRALTDASYGQDCWHNWALLSGVCHICSTFHSVSAPSHRTHALLDASHNLEPYQIIRTKNWLKI